jgi:hypothetical protein
MLIPAISLKRIGRIAAVLSVRVSARIDLCSTDMPFDNGG